ncbi:MAG: hypothetical protein GC164_00525 [Phycisphaera sp.]|nr:hypothetical protein [Phycisphaera sp.]
MRAHGALAATRGVHTAMANSNTRPSQPFNVAESRVCPRLRLPAMYTLVRLRMVGDKRYRWTGYAYDISRSGMRFELDDALKPGSQVEGRVMLPGYPNVTVAVKGSIVRMHDDVNEPGPVRMGMVFTEYATVEDSTRLEDYLKRCGLRAA